MNTESVITERGQITLPKELRDRLGLKAGTVITFVPSKQGILIRKAPSGESALKSVFGVVKDGLGTDDYLKNIRGDVE